MRQQKLLATVFDSLLCVALLIALSGCNNAVVHSGDAAAQDVGRRLESAVAAKATTFDFAKASAFPWDRVYIFGGYSDQASVDRELGFHWPEFSQTGVGSSEGQYPVAFVQGGRVTHWYVHEGDHVNFDPIHDVVDRARPQVRIVYNRDGLANLER